MTLNRRDFIKSLGAASATAMVPASFSTFASDADDYKALVCVFLKGGNDFFHQVVPLNNAQYQDYAKVRQQLAVPKARLLQTGIQDEQGIELGLHQSMKSLLPLLKRGKADLVLNVGPLTQPTTRAGISSGNAVLPPNLFAHNKQQETWQHCWQGDDYSKTGWLGMTADVLMDELGACRIAFSRAQTPC
ncbi:DUF1501 domain-containing protein [Enterovibrio coralii]|uniref:DUF1501 domain-containing protein n=1 Tax=Enterovibrio coralii TaxID=294935 RepID=UPI000A57446B|nr:DUF1501 domain-containing protein [Enterovibrio coralii]